MNTPASVKINLDLSKENSKNPIDVEFLVMDVENYMQFSKPNYHFEISNNYFKVGVGIDQDNKIPGCPNTVPSFPKSFNFSLIKNDENDIKQVVSYPFVFALYDTKEIGGSELHKDKTKGRKKSIDKLNIVPEKQYEKTNLLAFGYIYLIQHLDKIGVRQKLQLLPSEQTLSLENPIVVDFQINFTDAIFTENLKFSNMCQVTMECIYNFPEEMLANANPNSVEINFFFKPHTKNESEKEQAQPRLICSFKNCSTTLYSMVPQYKRWDILYNYKGLGSFTNMQSRNDVKNLYVDTRFNEEPKTISENAFVLVFNSFYRFALNESECIDFANLIQYLENPIIVELMYNGQQFLTGEADISVLLYPNVKNGRFLVRLRKSDTHSKEIHNKEIRSLGSVHNDKKPAEIQIGRKKGKNEKPPGKSKTNIIVEISTSAVLGNDDIFATFEINLERPLTERCPPYDYIDITNCFASETCIQIPNIEIDNTKDKEKLMLQLKDKIVDILKRICERVTSNVNLSTITNICKYLECTNNLDDIVAELQDLFKNILKTHYINELPAVTKNGALESCALLYNELIEIFENITDEYYCTMDNTFNSSKSKENRNVKIFLQEEYSQLRLDPGFVLKTDEKFKPLDLYDLFDMAMKFTREHDYLGAQRTLDEVFNIKPLYYYGMLLQAYLEFIRLRTDVAVSILLECAKIHPKHLTTWAILYCIFDENKYKPGMQYCWLKLNLYYEPLICDTYFWDRKTLFFPNPKTFEKHFSLISFYIVTNMGCYLFSKLLLKVFSNYFDPIDNFQCRWVLEIYFNNYENLEIQINNIFSLKKIEDEFIAISTKSTTWTISDFDPLYGMKKQLCLVFDGHLKFYKGEYEEAKHNYELVYHTAEKDFYDHLSFLRLGYMEINEGNYENAATYFITCCNTLESFLTWFGLGVCYYRMKKLKESEQCFSRTTNIREEISEPWLYLTLINLNFQRIEIAINCLKIAQRNCSTDKRKTPLWIETIEALRQFYCSNDNKSCKIFEQIVEF